MKNDKTEDACTMARDIANIELEGLHRICKKLEKERIMKMTKSEKRKKEQENRKRHKFTVTTPLCTVHRKYLAMLPPKTNCLQCTTAWNYVGYHLVA